VRENGREQGLTDKDVARKFTKEQAAARRRDSTTEQCCELQIESGLEKGDNTKQCRDFCDVERTRAIEKS